MSDDDHNRVPNWYREIFPAGPSDGFYQKMGYHAASFVDRGSDRLIVSFDNLSDAGNPYLDVQPWAAKFVQDHGWSHLGIYSRGPSWYRDARVNEFFDDLRDRKFFARFKSVTFTGTSMGGFAALAYSNHAPGSIVMALSPQSTLDLKKVPWENRFTKAQGFDWTLPYSDAAKTISKAQKIYVLYDHFLENDRKQVERLKSDKIIPLKGFGLGHKTAVLLRRMEMLKPVMEKALTGTLTQQDFYSMIRNRKDLLLYRKVMEAHLIARGKDHRVPVLQHSFRARRRKLAAAATAAGDPKTSSDPVPVVTVEAKTKPKTVAARSTPSSIRHPGGNAWMIEERDGVIRYMSDRYADRVIGFEERGGITLAQTPEVVLGHIAFGGAPSSDRPTPQDFRYHVVDVQLNGTGRTAGARAMGIATNLVKDAHKRGLRTVIATDVLKAGVTMTEAMPDGPLFDRLEDGLSTAVDAVEGWDKTLFVDRISLRLLTGAPDTTQAEAASHYVHTARALQRAIPTVTGQKSFPKVVISQTFGTRTDGRSTVALAEGMLDLDNPATGFIVATPTYPFALMDGMPATLDGSAQMLVDELEARAVAEVQQGREWRCPSLRYALIRGSEITAEFTAMSDLILEDGDHGFRIHDGDDIIMPKVKEVTGTTVTLTCDKARPTKDAYLTYAWGMTATDDNPYPANTGALRDGWQAQSVSDPKSVLHRYALSGRVKLVEAKDG